MRPEAQTYLCHPGNQGGQTCTFVLERPTRSRSIPYSHLLSVDAIGERFIVLHYSWAEVELSLGRDFPGKHQFQDDLVNFRVALLREGEHLRLRLKSEPFSEKTEEF
jgi:hypothetical protein